MLSNIFLIKEHLIKEKKFNISDVPLDDILNFISENYKKNTIIYPSVICRKFKIDVKSAYTILESGVSTGLFSNCLEVYCPYCNKFTGARFNSIADLPTEVYCDYCDEKITDPIRHSVVIYKVN